MDIEFISEFDEAPILNLSNYVSVTVTAGNPFTLSSRGFIESCLRIGYGPRSADELSAFAWLGGMGYSANRKKRRARLWEEARGIAERVGHGDEQEPMVARPDTMWVPLTLVSQVEEMFGTAKDNASMGGPDEHRL